MMSTLVIVFREVLEVSLILGVLVAATRGVDRRGRWIALGFLLGVLGSLLVARFAGAISEMAGGMGQEAFNAFVLLAASALIGWTVIWMNRHAREMARHFKRVSKDVAEGRKSLITLTIVTGLAVVREGSEIVLFVYGISASGQNAGGIITGSVLGLIAGSAVGLAIYYGLIRISPKYFFGVTSWLLVFVAAGMVSKSCLYLSSAGWLPEILPNLWNTSSILSENGFIGQTLHVLVGYSESPSGTQLIGYLTTLGLLGVGVKFWGKIPASSVPAIPNTIHKETAQS